MSRQVAGPNGVPVAGKIRLAQDNAGFRNEELARKIGVSVRLLQKWRAGSVTPRPDNLKRLARALDRPVGWFYEDEREAA